VVLKQVFIRQGLGREQIDASSTQPKSQLWWLMPVKITGRVAEVC
jgi:hypothetical protein